MMKTKNIIIPIIITLLILTSVNAEMFTLEPCGKTTTQETRQEIIMSNNCFDITMNKIYNPNIDFLDKQNNQEFQLHLMGLEERNLDQPQQKKNSPFANMGLTARTEGNTIYYSNQEIEIGYRLRKKQIKSIRNNNKLFL